MFNIKKLNRFWIHKFDLNNFQILHSNLILAAKNKNSKLINQIKPNDKILIFTSLSSYKKDISYVGFTEVDEIIENNEKIYKNLKSFKKLKLKGIKYFTKPILEKDLTDSFDFKNNTSAPFTSEFKEISSHDFNKIFSKSSVTKDFPLYFYNVEMFLDDFILKLIKSNHEILKLSNKSQIEIKSFIKILKYSLCNFNIDFSEEELLEFYSKNIWKLKIEHYPSRDSEKFVSLYTKSGHMKNFAYLSLE